MVHGIVRAILLPAAAALLLVALGAGAVSALDWQSETVDWAGTWGGSTSLALDAAGKPSISYFSGSGGDLMVASRDSAGWHPVTVDSAGEVGSYTSLALDAVGSPCISYQDITNRDLKYAWRNGTGWHAETVDAEEIA